MKIHYFVHCYPGYDTNDPYNLFRYAKIIDSTGQEQGNYLTSALSSDFLDYQPDHCDIALQKIEQIEAGEIAEYTWDGQGFQHNMKLDGVVFEHTIFGECLEWPLWSCSLVQYKAALQGWRKFIDMPKSLKTELIVDLPD